ncbi:hypothetical protein WA556_004839 [Blastocystis sp. ATCC 50177/Nand II]
MSTMEIELNNLPPGDLCHTKLDSIQNSCVLDATIIGINELQKLNNDIREFLKRLSFKAADWSASSCEDEGRVNNLLKATVARAITENIPLYDASASIADFIKEIANRPMNQYLVKKADGLELITQKHVLNYISRLNCSDDPVASNLQGERVPTVSRRMTIRDAMEKMVTENTSCLYIEPRRKEKVRVDRLTGLPYPKVVTLNQISTLLLQSLLEDGTINRNDSSRGRGQSEEDSDTEVETRSEGASVASYLGANASATPSLPVGEGAADATPEVNADRTLQDAKEVTEEVKKKELVVKQPMSLSKEGRSRISRFLNTPFVMIVMFVASLVDMFGSFLYLCDLFSYMKSFLSVFLTTLFLILDVLSILAENWETKKGMMRVIAYIADILVLNMIYMYFMLDFVSEHHARIWGSLIVILRMLRLYTTIIMQKKTLSAYFRKQFNRSRNGLANSSMDLTLITGHIIAMSWPGSSLDSMWRNNIRDVERYLNKQYGGNYWV